MAKKTSKAKPYKWESDVVTDVDGNVLDRKDRLLYRTPVNVDKFSFMFQTGMARLLGIGKMEMRVFIGILPFVKYNTGEFAGTLRKKLEVGGAVGLSERSVYHAIRNLVKSGLLLHHGLMDFSVNPQHFWVGTLEARNAALKEMENAAKKAPPPSLAEFFDNETHPKHLTNTRNED